MSEFDIVIPTKSKDAIDVTNINLYDYNFEYFSLSGLQEIANNQINTQIFEKVTDSIFKKASFIEELKILLKSEETEYVADLAKDAKKKLDSGEWKLGVRTKTGETYAVIKDGKTGRSKSFVNLKEKKIAKDLGMLPQLAAIQHQLKEISDQIENINKSVMRVQQGQYDDRYAGFISARQMVLEAVSVSDETIKKQLLVSSISLNNETIGKLMFAIHRSSQGIIDGKSKLKDMHTFEKFLNESLSCLNASVQLNVVAYTLLGEATAISTALRNYKAFIDQRLLKENSVNQHSIAWLIDNNRKIDDGQFLNLSQKLSMKISELIENKPIEIGENNYERIEE